MSEVAEVDYHLKEFGKKADEVSYGDDTCPFCNTRIDEFGLCGCIAGLAGAE